MRILPSAQGVKELKDFEAWVNGWGNYDSFKVAKRLVI